LTHNFSVLSTNPRNLSSSRTRISLIELVESGMIFMRFAKLELRSLLFLRLSLKQKRLRKIEKLRNSVMWKLHSFGGRIV
jgi:hypothetical protein